MIIGTDPFETPFDLAGAAISIGTWQMDARMVKVPRTRFEIDLLIRGKYRKTYRMSARIGLPTPTYRMDAVLVLDAADPRLTESFINSFFWAYANQWDQIDTSIQDVVHRLKLDFATSADLDDHWGRVLGVRRRGGESDADYRTRLATYIRKITSYGTPANVQAVIDRIVGINGASTIESFHPATVRLGWTDTETAKVAVTKTAQIEGAMDDVLAVGVSWSTAYPYAEYEMDWFRWLPRSVTYEASVAVARRRGFVYLAATGIWESGSDTYDADAIIYSRATITYRLDGRKIVISESSYLMNTKLNQLYEIAKTSDYLAGGWVSKSVRRSYMMTATLEAEI